LPAASVRQASQSAQIEFSRIELVDQFFTPLQQAPANNDPPAAANPFGDTLVTAHGVVRNAATGEPLPRAMVRIEGDAATGALTDGQGRFEIPGLPSGPQLFEVIKPGFQDRDGADGAAVMDDATGSAHNVILAPEMPDLDFSLSPSCSIHGQIELSTGESAQGIDVQLLKRSVQEGRAVWQAAGSTKTLSDGAYRFSGLGDGQYVVYTNPALDSESATTLVAPGRGAHVTREGYPSQFYPDARDLAGSAKIVLSNGEQAQANLTLTLEPFHTVAATAAFPDRGTAAGGLEPGASGMGYAAVVSDAQGHQLPYSAQYDPITRSIQALLPDGSFSLLLTATARFFRNPSSNGMIRAMIPSAWPYVGSVDFTVAGHAVSNLRVPLSLPRAGSARLTILHSASSGPAASSSQRGEVVVTASQAGGWIADGISGNFAQGTDSGPMDVEYIAPGSYWVHTHVSRSGLCEASFTAGGASLAREPLVINASGAAAPVELVVRDDCAKLTLSLPLALTSISSGEEHFYTVYVVPDFDSTVDVEPLTLRPTSGSTLTLEGLTPGNYHVYTFATPLALEYRNREALASLSDPGQSVTLSPGTTANLVLEAPGR